MNTVISRAGYDVVVAGARPAGAATAMLLAGAGLSTLVLDAGRIGTDTLSTHALMRGGVLQLHRWGLLDAIVDAGTPPVRRTTFHNGDDSTVISIKASLGVDALYAPRRTVLDPLLVHAAQRAGATVVERTKVTALLRAVDGRVCGVCAHTPDGTAIDIAAPLVIGADGINSTVARLAAAPITHRAEHTTAITYGYWSGLDADGYEWIFGADRCAGFIPTNAGQAVVFACATPARIGRGGVGVIADVVAQAGPELAGRLRRAQAPTATRTWPGQHGFLRHAHGRGWALVGDAGYFKDPIGAHGLTDALRDAELLARAVLSGFGRRAALDAALADFQATRDRLSLPLFEIVDRMASQRWDDREISDLLRRLSSAMTDEVETLAALEPIHNPQLEEFAS